MGKESIVTIQTITNEADLTATLAASVTTETVRRLAVAWLRKHGKVYLDVVEDSIVGVGWAKPNGVAPKTKTKK